MIGWLSFLELSLVVSLIHRCDADALTQLEVTTAVFLPVKNGTKLPDLTAKYHYNTPIDATSYAGESDDFPVDAYSVKNKFYIDNLKPAHEVAFRAALNDPNINIKFTVDYYLYMPCVAKVGWYSLKQMTIASRRASPQNNKKYDVFFGPPCFTDAYQAGIITMSYPVIVSSGSVTLADTLEPFINTVRCSYSTFTQWSIFMKMTVNYNWTNIAVFYDDSTSSISVWANSLMTRCNSAGVDYTQFSLTAKSLDISTMLDHARKLARIIVVLNNARLREVMVTAHSLNMTEGSYIYFIIDHFPYRDGTLVPTSLAFWKQGDGNDSAALAAYRSLYIFVANDVSDSSAAQAVVEAGKKLINPTDGTPSVLDNSMDKTAFGQNYFVRSTYDCVMVVARGIRAAFEKEGAAYKPPFNQKAAIVGNISRRYIAGTTTSGASGNMYLKANGDREEDFWVFAMTDRAVGSFAKVAVFYGSNSSYVEQPNMVWPNGVSPPVNTPVCGYSGIEGPCVPEEDSLPIASIAAGVAVPVGLLMIVILIFKYRHMKKLEREDKAWIAKWEDLDLVRPGGTSYADDNGEKREEAGDGDKEMGEMQESKTISETKLEAASHKSAAIRITENTGLWKKQAVTVRWCKKRRIVVNKILLKQAREVRTLSHDNLMAFKGACLDDDRIVIIYENCSKGCLTDLIADPNTKLEWTMRFSLISDCMKGVSYLHKSVLHVLGRLTSMCCYIDSRFVLKVGDYGLHTFFELSLAELWAVKREPEYMTMQLWKAPEHLRAESLSRYEVISSVSQKGDVYSFGVIIQELVLRSKPFSMYAIPQEEILEHIRVSANETQPRFVPKIDEAACPAELIDLCDRCWAVDPTKRPNMVQVRANMKELGKQLGMGERSNILDTLLQQMEDMELNINQIVEEKGQALLDEKNKSDQLLYSVLPKKVAETMKTGEKPRPENYELVSVLHCDIRQYADIAAESTPIQMVELLNDISDFYDDIIAQHDAYKVDTYKENTLIVSGLPHRNGNQHACEIARVALKLVYTIQTFRVKHRPDQRLGIRMGLHAGPVMAGVVGVHIPRYLLFGDTMSVSLQMLTGGEDMKIQMSLTSKRFLDATGQFDVEERGEVFVKGKGAMKTYWLWGELDNEEIEKLRRRYEEEDYGDEEPTDDEEENGEENEKPTNNGDIDA